jgi:hypothetical protein
MIDAKTQQSHPRTTWANTRRPISYCTYFNKRKYSTCNELAPLLDVSNASPETPEKSFRADFRAVLNLEFADCSVIACTQSSARSAQSAVREIFLPGIAMHTTLGLDPLTMARPLLILYLPRCFAPFSADSSSYPSPAIY